MRYTRARKFGGLLTLTPKGTLTLRKTLSPLNMPPNENAPFLENGLRYEPSALAANDLLSPLTNYPMSLSKQNVLIYQMKGAVHAVPFVMLGDNEQART